jgi:hypothetical protein
MKIAHSVVVHLPPTKIFAYVTNLDNLVEWSGTVIAVRKISAGEMAVGTMLRFTLRFMGRWIALKSVSAVAPCAFNFLFEPIEGDETRVSQEADIYLNLKSSYIGLKESVLIHSLNRHLENDLLTLKDLSESADH